MSNSVRLLLNGTNGLDGSLLESDRQATSARKNIIPVTMAASLHMMVCKGSLAFKIWPTSAGGRAAACLVYAATPIRRMSPMPEAAGRNRQQEPPAAVIRRGWPQREVSVPAGASRSSGPLIVGGITDRGAGSSRRRLW